MKTSILLLILFCFTSFCFAQNEFHVFPDGKSTGNGTLDNPWDLQTALSQSIDIVKGRDFLWIHNGIYNGRFISTLQGNNESAITVAAFQNEKVVLNGNVVSGNNSVLQVKGGNVVFKNFEVAFLGEFLRDEKAPGFRKIDGINHLSGENCSFVNLKVYDNPGSGFGSWKATGGSKILDCAIFNNGFLSKAGRGGGVGLYVQNNSSQERVISNNVIFNNYYKGIEVWSANKNAEKSYVQNVTLINNDVFNNGSPAGGFKDNLIIATDDKNGVNIAKNITVENNIFYHNTNVLNGEVGGDAASVTLGFNASAPVENVLLKNNIIIGRNNAFRILHAKSLAMENNIAYCGYVHLDSSVLPNVSNWKLQNNVYYTKKSNAFRVIKNKDYTVEEWKASFKIDENSSWMLNKQFKNNIEPKISAFSDKKETFKVSLIDTDSKSVKVDFSNYELDKGSSYRIVDVENPDEYISNGVLGDNQMVEFPMTHTFLKRPLANNMAQKTLSNFGVFIIEFNHEKLSAISSKSRLGKILDFLGF